MDDEMAENERKWREVASKSYRMIGNPIRNEFQIKKNIYAEENW